MKRFFDYAAIALFAASTVLLAACANPQSPSRPNAGTASVTIHLVAAGDATAGDTAAVSAANGSARTVLPELSGDGIKWAATLVRVPADSDHPDPQPVTGNTTGKITFNDIDPGTWLLTVSGTNSNNDEVATGSQTLTVVLSKTTQSFNVPVSFPSTGAEPGSFSLKLSFPASAGITQVEASLSDFPAETITSTPTGAGTTQTVTIASADRTTTPSVATGTYFLTINFWRGTSSQPRTTVVLTLVETVNIWSGIESNQWLNASGKLVGERTLTAADFADNNANLASVTVGNGKLTNGTTTGPLSPTPFIYDLEYNAPDLYLNVLRAAETQTVAYQLDNGGYTLLPGPTLHLLPVDLFGKTSLSIRVTAADGQTQKTYTFSLAPYYTVTYLPNGGTGSAAIVKVPAGATYQPTNSFTYTNDSISWRCTGWLTDNNLTIDNVNQITTMNRNLVLTAQWSVIGGTGPAGGLVFYDKGNYLDGWRYLEFQNSQTANSQPRLWATSPAADSFSSNRSIGSGKANTLYIANLIEGQAARLCQSISQQRNGIDYNDWFLPSENELLEVYTEIATPGLDTYNSDLYWTSTKQSNLNPSAINMTDGGSIFCSKTEQHYVRAVRAFADAQPLYAVVYDANGGSGAVPLDSRLYRKGQKTAVRAKPANLAKPGFIFKGWGTSPDANPLPIGTLLNITNDDYFLYALWEYDFANANITTDQMIPVPGDVFTQSGSGENSFNHTVSSFELGKFEVTYGLWYTVRLWAESKGYSFANPGNEGNTINIGAPPTSEGRTKPVTSISWRDAIVWCNAYSQMKGLTPVYCIDDGNATLKTATNATTVNPTAGSQDNPYVSWKANGYRLPSESEWQYAASFIDRDIWTSSSFASGAPNAIPSTIHAFAVYDTSDCATVGTKRANQLGIFDMSGNVSEWCWDWKADYPTTASKDYRGPDSPSGARIIRGASYELNATMLELGRRDQVSPWDALNTNGFRVARSLPLPNRTGLVGEWLFNGNGILTDTSGNGKNGINSNGNITWTNDYKSNAASALNIASAGYVNIANNSAFQFGENSIFTVSLWFNTNQNPATDRWSGLLMQHSVNTDYFDYLILIAPGPKISINADAHGTSGAVVAANFTPDVWNHVGLRYANRILTLYLNGINMGSATFNLSTPSPANGPLTFGGGSGYYEGLLDDIRIYNRALSAEEIYALSKE